jgi:hypothetical protein
MPHLVLILKRRKSSAAAFGRSFVGRGFSLVSKVDPYWALAPLFSTDRLFDLPYFLSLSTVTVTIANK